MVAEAVASLDVRLAMKNLPDQRTLEAIENAIYAIENDPGWNTPNRYLSGANDMEPGSIADLSVSGWAIIYKVVDHGAAVEIWYLYEINPRPRRRRRATPGMPPAM